MKKLILTLSLLYLTTNFALCQKCDCKLNSDDKIEKLIAKVVQDDDSGAISLCFHEIMPENIQIDPNLFEMLSLLKYNNWFTSNRRGKLKVDNVDKLREQYNKLHKYQKSKKKKTTDPLAANFWIKSSKDRLICFDQILKKLEQNRTYLSQKDMKPRERSKDSEIRGKTALDDSSERKKTIIPPPNEHIVDTPIVILTPPQALTDRKKRIIDVDTIYFNEDEITLDNLDIQILKKINDSISSSKVTEIILEGFASETGSRETNFAISMSRCYEVKKQIVTGGYINDFDILPVGKTDNKDFRAVIITLKSIKSVPKTNN